MRVEAEGFAAQQNDNVVAGLGQKQTANFVLKVSAVKETVEVSGDGPLVNPGNANTASNLERSGAGEPSESGRGLTYPLQFAAGALMNTAGSGNDFVGGTNGYGNVEFKGFRRFERLHRRRVGDERSPD